MPLLRPASHLSPAVARRFAKIPSWSSTPLLFTSPHTNRISLERPRYRQQSTSSDAVEPPDYLSDAELKIFNKLKSELQPIKLDVQDISGGCGSMYGLDIVSSKFQGLSIIKQHQLVNRLLSDELKSWHGMQLKTKAP